MRTRRVVGVWLRAGVWKRGSSFTSAFKVPSNFTVLLGLRSSPRVADHHHDVGVGMPCRGWDPLRIKEVSPPPRFARVAIRPVTKAQPRRATNRNTNWNQPHSARDSPRLASSRAEGLQVERAVLSTWPGTYRAGPDPGSHEVSPGWLQQVRAPPVSTNHRAVTSGDEGSSLPAWLSRRGGVRPIH